MHVSEVRIEGLRGFGQGERGVRLDLHRPDGSLAGWTVIAGRNGAGKSTLLRVIALSIAGQEAARTLQDSFAGWIHHGADSGTVATQLAYAGEDRFQEVGRIREGDFWTGLRWSAPVGGPEPKLTPYLDLNRSGRKAPGRGPWAENPQGWLLCGYGPFRRLGGEASSAQRIMSGPRRLAGLVTLFREDASLFECVAWLKSVYMRAFEEKRGAEELMTSILALLNDGLLPDGARAEKIDSEGLWVNQQGVLLTLDALSDGYRTAAALVVDIAKQMFSCFGSFSVEKRNGGPCRVRHAGIVLIDEIDIHLHVSWQQRIGFWLKERFPNVQFLVTTHSPFICQAADERGLIRLGGPGDEHVAEHVDADTFKRIVNGSADEAILTTMFGLDRTRSQRAEKLRKEYGSLRAKQIIGRVSPKEVERLKILQQELPGMLADSVDIEVSDGGE